MCPGGARDAVVKEREEKSDPLSYREHSKSTMSAAAPVAAASTKKVVKVCNLSLPDPPYPPNLSFLPLSSLFQKAAAGKVPSHPTYSAMIKAAIKSLKESKGSSKAALLKYIITNYKVGSNIVVVSSFLFFLSLSRFYS